MKLVSIPQEKYAQYKLDAMFDCYKWDCQFYDNTTLSKYILVLSWQEHKDIEKQVRALSYETVQAEMFLKDNLEACKPLGLPSKFKKLLPHLKNYNPSNNLRLMRFDFHPIVGGGFAISEVNSDVPGGFAESSLLPKVALRLLDNPSCFCIDFIDILTKELASRVKLGGKIMLVHCTIYSDDRQVMQALGDKLCVMGYDIIYCAANHISTIDDSIASTLNGNQGAVEFVFRFVPIDWMIDLKSKGWYGLFCTTTPQCNHPIAVLTQTKKFPLVWDALKKHNIELPSWHQLLPHTQAVTKHNQDSTYIYKPVAGRVGENISIKEACRGNEYQSILREVKRHPKKYISQKRFESQCLVSDDGQEFHVCMGAYTVQGNPAGYYARISALPRIDSYAADIAVIIEEDRL